MKSPTIWFFNEGHKLNIGQMAAAKTVYTTGNTSMPFCDKGKIKSVETIEILHLE